MPSKFNFIHVGKGLGVIHMFVLPLIYIGLVLVLVCYIVLVLSVPTPCGGPAIFTMLSYQPYCPHEEGLILTRMARSQLRGETPVFLVSNIWVSPTHLPGALFRFALLLLSLLVRDLFYAL